MGGGRSSTQHTTEGGALTFAGMLDTRGGGFTSVRADFAGGLKGDALRVRFRGDGKTYKVLLSNGQGGGPWSNNPSWQHDLPTKLGEEQSVVLPLAKFVPSFGGQRSHSHAGSLNPKDMAQVGFMPLCISVMEPPTRKKPSYRRARLPASASKY